MITFNDYSIDGSILSINDDKSFTYRFLDNTPTLITSNDYDAVYLFDQWHTISVYFEKYLPREGTFWIKDKNDNYPSLILHKKKNREEINALINTLNELDIPYRLSK